MPNVMTTSREIPGLLVVADVAAHLRCSERHIHELVRHRRIPHLRIRGTRRCLFHLDEIRAWANGCELTVEEYGDGGRRVRPADSSGSQGLAMRSDPPGLDEKEVGADRTHDVRAPQKEPGDEQHP
jgi:excisionase family DNA binding protein